jgi:hypothetical protein
MMNPVGLISVTAGVFTLCGALFDWDWFMNHRKARLFVALLTRTGARVFYALLGSVLIVLGILLATGIIKGSH